LEMRLAPSRTTSKLLAQAIAMKFLTTLFTVLFLFANAADAAAEKKLILIAGKPSHPSGMHEFRAGCLLLQKCLAGTPGLAVEVYSNGWPTKVEGGQTNDDNAVFAGAAAVVIYCDGGPGHPAIRPDRVKLLDEMAAKGVGLGFAHYGVEVPAGDPGAAMQRWIGGHYEHQFSVNPMWSPDYTNFPAHPVARGVKPFSNRDEWYFNMRWAPTTNGVTPILVATPSDAVRKGPYVYPKGPYDHIIAASGRPEVMMWTFERPNGGRGFGFTGGHTHANWGDPNQRKVVLNALLWLAKLEVPADGVSSAVGPEDLQQNLDPKSK
jgi:type 1 glutamine amidotransferase